MCRSSAHLGCVPRPTIFFNNFTIGGDQLKKFRENFHTPYSTVASCVFHFSRLRKIAHDIQRQRAWHARWPLGAFVGKICLKVSQSCHTTQAHCAAGNQLLELGCILQPQRNQTGARSPSTFGAPPHHAHSARHQSSSPPLSVFGVSTQDHKLWKRLPIRTQEG